MIRCRTVRQLSAQEKWDTEFVLSIKGTPWSPDGERAGDVNIRVDLPEARGDRGVHPPDIDPPIIPRRMRLTREMFERFGLTAQCLGCRAIRTGIGYPANEFTQSLMPSINGHFLLFYHCFQLAQSQFLSVGPAGRSGEAMASSTNKLPQRENAVLWRHVTKREHKMPLCSEINTGSICWFHALVGEEK